MYHWKKNIKILVLIFFLLGIFLCIKNTEINYKPTEYEEELISYFKEIALQSEYDDSPQRIIKWKESMMLFVVKEEEFNIQMIAIQKTIDEINQLVRDEFKIVLTDNISKSNSVLYLCNKEKVAELNPSFYRELNDGIDNEISGLAYLEFNTKSYIIDTSLIFVNSEDPVNEQESTILEEITQSLGLAFDSNKYPNSVFYQKKYEREVVINEYTVLDKDVVKLLYHPKMRSGMDSTEVERVIKRILKSEKEHETIFQKINRYFLLAY